MSRYPHLEALIDTMATLRGEHGCEWDREQTHESLVVFLIEEVHELIDAIESGDRDEMREELGDVLYQLLFHIDIARSDPDQPFDIDDVARVTNEKMRRRHPHVFAGQNVSGVEQIRENWQEIKAAEKSHRDSVLDGVPASLQGLARAHAMLKRSERIGVGVDATTANPPDTSDDQQWGQWLLGVIETARSQGIDTDQALRGALRDFETRVRAAERPE